MRTKGNEKQFLICSTLGSGSLAIGLGLDKSCSRRQGKAKALFGLAFMSNENVGLMLSKFNCLCRNTLSLSPSTLLFVITLFLLLAPCCGVNPTTKPPTWRTRVFVLSQQRLPCPVPLASFSPPLHLPHSLPVPAIIQSIQIRFRPSRNICIVCRRLAGEACAPDYDNCMKL